MPKPVKSTPSPEAAARILRPLMPAGTRLAIVLGSGFHHLPQRLEQRTELPYTDIPGFPKTGVTGHAGKLYAGRLGGTPVLVLSGRAHFYEGHSLERVTFPVRALAAAGIGDLLLTNAAGGIHPRFRAGDLMVVTDHINLMGANPLRGPEFVDLTQAYDPGLWELLQAAGRATGLRLRSGVYLAVSGPSYETPAEIHAFARLGADAVGMSTVPEVIVARHCRMNVAALSCITNLAAGRTPHPLSHVEVMEIAKRVQGRTADLLTEFAALYGRKQK